MYDEEITHLVDMIREMQLKDLNYRLQRFTEELDNHVGKLPKVLSMIERIETRKPASAIR